MNILFFLKPKSEVDYIEENASVMDTVMKMQENNYSEIPVIDHNGEYIGTIKSGDILTFITQNRDLTLSDTADIALGKVKRLRDNKAVNINCQIEDLVEMILNQNFVPVVDDEEKFIGIVTRSAVVRYMHGCYMENNKTGDK